MPPQLAVESMSQTTRIARDPALAARMRKALLQIAIEKRERLAEIKDTFPIEHIWADFMKQDAFRLALWESQRSSYLAFYNAYEAFLVSCLKIGTGRTCLRAADRDFKEVLRTGLLEDIAKPCWFHGEILLAREVRNALSHNGGQESPALKKIQHKLKVIDEDVHIVAGDVHRMLMRLRLAVEKIISVTKCDPKFLSNWTSTETGD